jgi:hypothetical protein
MMTRRTKPLTKVNDNILELSNGHLINISKKGNWQAWQQFLEIEKSFRYERAGLSFTAIKETRRGSKKHPLRGGGEIEVWYAHKRIANQLKRKYLGYSENLTVDKLQSVIFNMKPTHIPSQNKIKSLARNAVNNHNWKGTPWLGECEVCHRSTTNESLARPSYLVAHHWKGYDKSNWLNVWWICGSCNRYLPHDGSMTINEARNYLQQAD